MQLDGSMFVLFHWLLTLRGEKTKQQLFFVSVLGVTQGNAILDLSLGFISGKERKNLGRGAVKLWLSVGSGPVSSAL